MTIPRIALHTLGCKLNAAETATIGRQFLDRGYRLVEFGTVAEVCLINTCTVTERADRECRQIIRRARRTAPGAFVIVTGCYAQLAPEEIASIDGVDAVLGSREKFAIFDHLDPSVRPAVPRVCASELEGVTEFGPAYAVHEIGRTRGYLKVQDGCDYLCSFCTIPRARGGSRSQALEECVGQARTMIAAGSKEIVLTGVNLGDYRGKTGERLVDLLRALVDIAGLERLRISSIEPNLLSDEIINLVASDPRICRHLHIPLQSGSESVLRRMRRRYTVGDYRQLQERLVARIPDCGIGVDVIVGFPGETDEEFDETYRLLHELPVSYLHVFTYSERAHTAAAAAGRAVPPQVGRKRNAMLRMLSQKKRHAFYRAHLGKERTALTESTTDGTLRLGLTDNYIRVGIPGVEENTLLRIRITDVGEDRCRAEAVGEAT